MSVSGSTVSVVIPTYNRRELLFKALASVFAQTRPALEVIVVDDGSTDGTCAALEGAQFPCEVHTVRLPGNQGASAARNAGILRARGKYVAFLDSDDVWLGEHLQHVVALLEDAGEKTVAYTQYILHRPQEVRVFPARAMRLREPLADYLFMHGGYIQTSTVALPTKIARQVLYDPQMRMHEDWDFYIRLVQHGMRFLMVAKPLSVYVDIEPAHRASSAKPHLSLQVLERWRPQISQGAYLSFRAHIAPQLRGEAPLRALRLIAEAYSKGAINSWFLVVLTGSLLHPKLRELAYLLRGRWQGGQHP